MPQEDFRYDPKTSTLWLYRDYDADTLVPKSEMQEMTQALKKGETNDGQPVKAINYVFPKKETAEYNHSALAFARFGTFYGSLQDPTPIDEEAPSFSVREDFGID